ncbi:hypothetical protein GX50_08968 [[Emmonsia] crescens]|uniref:CCHC-type domain-containing protein n=1 Tax=[Emmonsia] crescens TaxID=73230 RepID=A0A2B7Z3W2_9EURO|nr:hypothetical protein GX50_08968 [Emmonsia crescens]
MLKKALAFKLLQVLTRVSTVQTGFQVPEIAPEEAADQHQQEVCINCNQPEHIAFNCRSAYLPPHPKERSTPAVRANHAALEEDSDNSYENTPTKQRKD